MSPHPFFTSRNPFRGNPSTARALMDCRGFTFVEILITFIIIGVLASLALPAYAKIKEKVQNVRAMEEIRSIEKAVNAFSIDNGGNYPTTLAQVRVDHIKDPWGNGYVYHRPGTAFPADEPEFSSARAIIPGTPLNEDFDLFSKGPDGHTDPDVTASPSLDDIIRTGEGGWVGLASEL